MYKSIELVRAIFPNSYISQNTIPRYTFFSNKKRSYITYYRVIINTEYGYLVTPEKSTKQAAWNAAWNCVLKYTQNKLSS